MGSMLKMALTGALDPLLRRPDRVQMAALCFRTGKRGKELLLVTSRDTGRWVLPKGWPINGLDGPGTAAQEAWEEGGVKAKLAYDNPVGEYGYLKKLDNGASVPVTTTVYEVEAETVEPEFPEVGQRKRRWVDPKKASSLVEEPELRRLLKKYAKAHA